MIRATIFALLSTHMLLINSGYAQKSPETHSELASASAVNIAELLVRADLSGGFALKLPSGLDQELSIAEKQTDVFEIDRSAFGILVRASRGRKMPELAPGTSTAVVLRQFAAAKADPDVTVSESVHQTSVLKDAKAGICHARLQQRVRSDYSSGDVLDLVSKITHDATGAAVPPGFVGTCLPHRGTALPRINVAAGETLEDALNAIVAHVAGTVWIAVESGAGRCALGIVQRGEHGNACVANIASNLAR